jgi:hypothetical protein
VSYVAQYQSVTSGEALNNPFIRDVTLANDFLSVPFMEQTVTDSHYESRTREGRHVAFLARMISDWQMDARGIGVNDYTAVGVDENGIAHVFGNPAYNNHAWFIKALTEPEIMEENKPLHWYGEKRAMLAYRIKGNRQGSNTFSLSDWETGSGGEWFYWYVDQGELTITPAGTVNTLNPEQGSLFRIVPNPAVNSFQIKNTSGKPVDAVQIFDTRGRLFLQSEGHQGPFDISKLNKGIYFVTILQENSRTGIKLIKTD